VKCKWIFTNWIFRQTINAPTYTVFRTSSDADVSSAQHRPLAVSNITPLFPYEITDMTVCQVRMLGTFHDNRCELEWEEELFHKYRQFLLELIAWVWQDMSLLIPESCQSYTRMAGIKVYFTEKILLRSW